MSKEKINLNSFANSFLNASFKKKVVAGLLIIGMILAIGYTASQGVQWNISLELQARLDYLETQQQLLNDTINIPVNSTISAMVKTCSYIVSVHDSYYCLINGSDDRAGRLEYYGSNASQVANFAWGNLTRGGLILLKDGITITNPIITSNDGVTIQGQKSGKSSGNSTFIRLANGANCDIFLSHTNPITTSSPRFGITIKDLEIDGNKANNPSGGCGIKGVFTWSTFDGLHIHDTKGDGIRLLTVVADPTLVFDQRLYSVKVNDADGSGILIDNQVNDGRAYDTEITGCAKYGFYLNNSGAWQIFGGSIYDNAYNQMYVKWGADNIIQGVTFDHNNGNYHTLDLEGSHRNRIIGNLWQNGADGTPGTFYNIFLDWSEYCVVTSNIFRSGTYNPTWCIYEDGDATRYNAFGDDSCFAGTTGGICLTAGGNSGVSGCWNATTWLP